ncbi:translocation/assembly module TamB domain-containing protein [Chlorogloeopsis sp. ULAP01]|uniref:translocation/assembly module TamB domain-containing protein n=1 Tax=Chlorogloeopsis sp. ULAP01 TaxID=3056483 RepID=UPI0025AABADD|nr:translocation/assembly module TamB domain-containing protein [Chlorogloeopsis sp. ULAP01]MDM9383840.1 translocation/assembly module TamB domain-containing protein [Chlorogloeopsis sp. ULAP01]
MTNQPQRRISRRTRQILLGGGCAISGATLVGVFAGSWWAYKFIDEQLSPLIVQNLQDVLNRPVEVGKVQKFGFTNIIFGRSTISPTATDPNQVNIERIVVNFNLLDALLTQTLPLKITLERPNIFLSQNQQGQWTIPQINQSKLKTGLKDSPIKINPNIQVQNGTAILSAIGKPSRPYSLPEDLSSIFATPKKSTANLNSKLQNQVRSVVKIENINANLSLQDNYQLIGFDFSGKPVTGGSLQLQGNANLKLPEIKLQAAAQNFLASDITLLLPTLPAKLLNGRLSSNVNVHFPPNNQPLQFGGKLSFRNLAAKFDAIPKPITYVNGSLQLQGERITLEEIRLRYGGIPLRATGSLTTQDGYNLKAQVLPVSATALLKTLDLKSPVPVAGEFGVDTRITGAIAQPIITGIARNTKPVKVDKVNFATTDANFQLTPQALILQKFLVTPADGGAIVGKGNIKLDKHLPVALNLQLQDLPADAIASSYGIKGANFTYGKITANGKINGELNKIRGNFQWQAPQATYPGKGNIDIAGNNLLFRDMIFSVAGGNVRVQAELFQVAGILPQRWQVLLEGSKISLNQFAANMQGLASGRLQLSGSLNNVNQATMSVQGQAQLATNQKLLSVAPIKASLSWLGDKLQIQQASIPGLELDGLVFTQQLPGKSIPTISNLDLNARLQNFNLATVPVPIPDAIRLAGKANFNGHITGNLETLNLAGKLGLNQFAVNDFVFDPTLNGQLQFAPNQGLNLNLTGQQDKISLQLDKNYRAASFLLQQGETVARATAKNFGKDYRLVVNLRNLRLDKVTKNISGLVNGSLQVSGSWDNINKATIKAQGNAQIPSSAKPQPIGPIIASLRWQKDKLQIQQASAPGIKVDGWVFVQQAPGEMIPSISTLELNTQLINFNLGALPIPVPDNAIRVAGKANFNGRITGNLETLNLAGKLGLNQFAVNDFAFEPSLRGQLQFAQNHGLSLNLTGKQDRITLQLDHAYRPTNFLLQQGQTIARATTNQGDRTLAEVRNLPLEKLAIAPADTFGLGVVKGNLNGNFDLNLTELLNPAVVGVVSVTQPALGYIGAELFTGQFHYANGTAILSESELRKAQSRLSMTGSLNLKSDPQLQAKITAHPINLQDILAALHLFELSDFSRGLKAPEYASAKVLRLSPVGNYNANLSEQLKLLADISQRQKQAQEQAALQLPELSQLQGTFLGNVDVAFSPHTGLGFKYGLRSQDLNWGEYQVEQAIAQGNFQNGLLAVSPLKLESGRSLVAFSGQAALDKLSGQLVSQNIPISPLRKFFDLPVDIQGDFNSNVNLAGNYKNPQVAGELFLTNASLNQTPINQAQTLFSYNNARLNFNGELLATNSQNPLRLGGSIPYTLPFTTAFSNNDEFRLDVNLKDDGLSLINALTNGQMNWAGGKAAVEINAKGTVRNINNGLEIKPFINGAIDFDKAAFAASNMQKVIESLTGNILFNFDHIQFDKLQANVANANVLIQGFLPIFKPENSTILEQNKPLTITLNNQKLRYKNLFRGNIDGQVSITGSALAPIIGGQINLEDTKVEITSLNSPLSSSLCDSQANQQITAAKPIKTNEGNQNFVSIPKFNNLRLNLDNEVRLKGPLFNFSVAGKMAVNGTLLNPLPKGEFNIHRGSINLYTTEFRLVSSRPNTASFVPSQGLDPILNVEMYSVVSNIDNPPITNHSALFPSSEFADLSNNNFGEIGNIIVDAKVEGPACKLFENLQLTSTPKLSEEEIVNLIGGNTVNNLSLNRGLLHELNRGILSELNNLVNNILGLDNFKLYNTNFGSKDGRGSENTVVAEVAFNVNPKLSVSASSLLNSNTLPFRLGGVYRLNEDLTVRGYSQFMIDNRIFVEYRKKF